MGETNYNRGALKRSIGRLACAALVAAMLAGCAHRSADLSKPATQDNFGVEMAQMNLWREAMFRFQRAVQLNPSDAMAHNNLAVAYEANGDFENAAKEYKEALRLDRSNSYIQKNYSRYTEFMSRSKKRQKAPVRAASATTPASETSSSPTATASPVTPVGRVEPVAPTAAPAPAAPPSPAPPAPAPQRPPGGF